MPTPKDKQRTAAIRKWLKGVDLIAAARATGIAPRALQRFYSGKDIPPPRLLEEIADRHCPDVTLAAALRAAAAAPEPARQDWRDELPAIVAELEAKDA